MNQGIFGFPTPLTGSILSVAEFDASGTYTIPEEASSLEFILVGGGGGGGSGRRAAGTPTTILAGGGGGGSGGGLTHHIVYKDQIKNMRNLIITIGQGGLGAASASGTVNDGANNPGVAGVAGGNSFITSPENKLFVISASGGLGGNGGTTPTAAGSAAGGSARNYFISSIPLVMVAGGNGSADTLAGGPNGPNLQYNNFRSNGGCGGGSATSSTNAFAGGSINVPDNRYTEPFAINFNYTLGSGLTIVSGGNANLGNVVGAGQNGVVAYTNSMGFQFFSGIGGGGGGAANTVGGGNGGNGYRGGGGGGGGGFHSATTTTNRSGSGGNGGNGYCRIIARK